MPVELDLSEMYYLLDNCLRGSHLRASTVERFVDEWFDKFTEQQRYNLYEWALRLTYSYHKQFIPMEQCCGADIMFMRRYDPENQFMVTTRYQGKVERHLAFGVNNRFYVSCRRAIAGEYITKVERYVPKVERTDFELNFHGRRH